VSSAGDNTQIDLSAQIDADSAITPEEVEADRSRRAARRTWVPPPNLGPEPVALELWNRDISHDDNPEAYENRWWDALPKKLKESLKHAALDFQTFADWQAAHLRAVSVSMNRRPGNIQAIWRASRISAPLISFAETRAVLAMAPPDQRRWLAKHIRELTRASHDFFGLKAHRMSTVAERDWQITRCVVEGRLSERQAWQHWREIHPTEKLKFSAARAAIRRTMPKVLSDWFARTLSIYVTNFPSIPALTCACQTSRKPKLPCRRCRGTGRLPQF
jgi:hypothetical protein